jgi:3-hydroxyisobutyrate dehydrogenase
VSFVGLGTMGTPMATRIAQAGFSLTVFDLRHEAASALAGTLGCRLATSLAEAGEGADLAITMLPTSREVEAVLFGDEAGAGLVSRMTPGSVVIDMSSSDPLRTRALATRVADAGVTLVDAPVSGAVRRARDGSLAIMFGGSAADLECCRPVLSCMGSAIFHVGATGAGHAMKALNNYVSAAGLVATVEALHAGERFGIDPHVMTQVLNASTGRNNTTEHKVEPFMLSGSFASGFFLRLMSKDVRTAISLAHELGVPVRLGDVCADMWEEAAGRSAPDTDHTEMYRLLQR